MHDIITGAKGVADARAYTPRSSWTPGASSPPPTGAAPLPAGTADPDQHVLSDQDLEQAAAEGEQQG
jgi:hypothetical protein